MKRIFITLFFLQFIFLYLFGQADQIPETHREEITEEQESEIIDLILSDPNSKVHIGDKFNLIIPQVQYDYTATVNTDHTISFQGKVGSFRTKGKTILELKKEIVESTKKIFPYGVIDLNLVYPGRITVYISGYVQNPGLYVLAPIDRITDLLAKAQKLESGSIRNISLIRNGKTINIDLFLYYKGIDYTSNIRLEPEDRIHIPLVEKTVKIKGQVHIPGKYELNKDENLMDLFKYAGNLTEFAYKKEILVTRFVNQQRENIYINLDQDEKQDIPLENMDTIEIFSSQTFLEEFVFMNKGNEEISRINFAKNEKVADIIIRSGGLPNNVDYNNSYIIRQIGKNTTKIFLDLDDVMKRDPVKNILLQNNDRIYLPVLSDYIYIVGEVMNSGTRVPFAEKRKARYYINKSGGAAPGQGNKFIIEIVDPDGKIRVGNYNSNINQGETIIVPTSIITNYERIVTTVGITISSIAATFALTTTIWIITTGRQQPGTP